MNKFNFYKEFYIKENDRRQEVLSSLNRVYPKVVYGNENEPSARNTTSETLLVYL